MVNSRRSNDIRSQDLERLKRLLDLGISPKGVRAYAQSTFNVSRQQAHRDTVRAMADRSKDKRVKPCNNEKRKMIEASMNLLFQSMLKAEMDNDPSALSRLSKELRELLKLAPDLSKFPEPQWEDEQFSSFEESVS
mgnify:FL=1|tara:strand:- start:10 stop:417 length:408 start_codon:yes stop_codon:yes gene_type:complete